MKSPMVSVTRISRNTLAITIVEECKSDDTGVGPSMALGSQGWNRNCADLATIPTSNPREITRLNTPKLNSCCPLRIKITRMAMYNPKSLTRLYITAWSAEVLASLRPGHQEISRNDRIPTLSHLSSMNIKLVQEVKQNINVIKRTIKKMNLLNPGSSLM